MQTLSILFDASLIIRTAGYLGIFAVVFAESGFLVGFFLPGDSLLFTAGFLASQHYLNIAVLIVGNFIAAVLGDSFGYMLGYRFGPRVFAGKDSLVFNKEHLDRTQEFYEKYGGKTIIFARFLPVVRTVAPILAGTARMSYGTFLVYNIVGGALWSMGLSLLGFFLGNTIPNVDHYLIPIVILIIFLSVLPGIIHLLRNAQTRKELKDIIKGFFYTK